MLSYHSLDLHLPMENCVCQELHYFGFLTRSLFADSAALSSASALSSFAAYLASLSPKKNHHRVKKFNIIVILEVKIIMISLIFRALFLFLPHCCLHHCPDAPCCVYRA